MNVTLGDVCQLKRNPFKSFPFYGMFHLLLLIFRPVVYLVIYCNNYATA